MGQTWDVPPFPKLLSAEGAAVAVRSGLLRVSGEGWKFEELVESEERSRAGNSEECGTYRKD